MHFAWDSAPELSWISMPLVCSCHWVRCGCTLDRLPAHRHIGTRGPLVSVWGASGPTIYCHHCLFLLPIPHFFHGLTYFNTNKNCCNLCFAEGGTKKLRSTIRRSTETGIAVEMRNRVTRQGSKDSTDGSTNSNSSDGT